MVRLGNHFNVYVFYKNLTLWLDCFHLEWVDVVYAVAEWNNAPNCTLLGCHIRHEDFDKPLPIGPYCIALNCPHYNARINSTGRHRIEWSVRPLKFDSPSFSNYKCDHRVWQQNSTKALAIHYGVLQASTPTRNLLNVVTSVSRVCVWSNFVVVIWRKLLKSCLSRRRVSMP